MPGMKELSGLVARFRKDTGVEESLIWYLIVRELERIHREHVDIHLLRFVSLETELRTASRTGEALLQRIAKMERELAVASERGESKRAELEAKAEILQRKRVEIKALEGKLAEIGASLRATQREAGQLEYDIMMKRHHRREQSDASFRRTKFLLTLLTAAAVVIALFLLGRS